jgi:RNA 3'-terminal phosphate cyclase (ATP)
VALIKIDGSYGEGGGQIIRTCLSLSVITGKTVEIANIRAGRSKPGLQPQHLMAVRAAAELCAANLEGANIGSTRLEFEPQSPVAAGNYRFEIGTAGATTLVAQTLILPLCLARGVSRVEIVGGTHVPHAPPVEFLQRAYLLALKEFGFACRAEYDRAGFFPKGGGNLTIFIGASGTPATIDLSKRGRLCSLKAYVITSELPDHVGFRGMSAIEKFMKGIGRSVEVVRCEKKSLGPGAAVVMICNCEGGIAGFTSLGERGKPMEKVTEEACVELMDWWKSGAACDEHLGDQLVLPASLVEGESVWTVLRATEHLHTVLWVAQQFLPIKYKLDEAPEGTTLVRVQGAGLTSS